MRHEETLLVADESLLNHLAFLFQRVGELLRGCAKWVATKAPILAE